MLAKFYELTFYKISVQLFTYRAPKWLTVYIESALVKFLLLLLVSEKLPQFEESVPGERERGRTSMYVTNRENDLATV